MSEFILYIEKRNGGKCEKMCRIIWLMTESSIRVRESDIQHIHSIRIYVRTCWNVMLNGKSLNGIRNCSTPIGIIYI
jgi:hypothetical protein